MVWAFEDCSTTHCAHGMNTALHAQTQMGHSCPTQMRHSCPTASKWRGGGVEEVVEAVSGVLFYCYRFITAELGEGGACEEARHRP